MFLTAAEFQTRYKVAPKQIPGIAMEQMCDEEGSPMTGILLQDDPSPQSSSFRRVRIFCETTVHRQEEFHQGALQLRENQGAEVATWLEGEERSKRPARMKPNAKNMTIAELDDHVKATQEKATQGEAPSK
eukprot:5401015-Alexandrium_andersonii.AAC.1